MLLVVCLAALGPGLGGSEREPEEPDAAPGSLEQANHWLKQARYADAEALCRELLVQAEKEHGASSLEAARILDSLVQALYKGGKAAAPGSRELAERAVRLKEDNLGPDHPEVAQSLGFLGVLLYYCGAIDQAITVQKRGLEIREKALGSEDVLVARSLGSLGMLYSIKGQLSQARSFMERALAIEEAALGPDHAQVGKSLNNLAILSRNEGDLEQARRLFERALTIKQRSYGLEHPDVATGMSNLGLILDTLGETEQARTLIENALVIEKRTLGPRHPQVSKDLIHLALLIEDEGALSTAKAMLEEALAIREASLGPMHPDTAKSLRELSSLYIEMGDLAQAQPLRERALAIVEASYGREHVAYASGLCDLALLYGLKGEDEKAGPLFEESIRIGEKALGPEHFDMAGLLEPYALYLERLGKTEQARDLLERILAIREKNLGPDAPVVSWTLNRLAEVIGASSPDKGLEYCTRALRIQDKAFGPENGIQAWTLSNMARLDLLAGRPVESMDAALRCEEIRQREIRAGLRDLSERMGLRFVPQWYRGIDQAVSLLVADQHKNERWTRDVWNALIGARALVLEELAMRQRAVAKTDDPETGRLIQEVAALRQRFARLTVKGADGFSPEHYKSLLDRTREEKEKAEEALARKSAGFRREQARSRVRLEDVAGALPGNGALVAFAKYDRLSPLPEKLPAGKAAAAHLPADPARSPSGSPIPSYVAFVLRSGRKSLAVVPLGEAERMDDLVSRWHLEISQRIKDPWETEEACEARYRAAGQALRETLWDPVAPYLKGAELVLVVPDGSLHRVNLAALPVGKSRYLAEAGFLIHYLSAERDVVYREDPFTRGEGLLAIGDVHFGANKAAAADPLPGRPPGCKDFRSLRFQPLPATGKEARAIAAFWNRGHGPGPRSNAVKPPKDGADVASSAEVLTGAAATEQAFKAEAPGKRILHLATHGFFLDAGCPIPSGDTRGRFDPALSRYGVLLQRGSDNPLLRSGLALAGANDTDALKRLGEDGLLTSEEIASLDLNGVEWAVLSACNTGLGEIRDHEGVLGLRRAFQVAGVRTLIMSLWPVKDDLAHLWMNALYQERLLHGGSTAQAVREANLRLLKGLRKQGRSTHPNSWAGFVAAGDWR